MPWISEKQVDALIPGGFGDRLPNGAFVRQRFETPKIDDIPSAVREQLRRPQIAERIRPGMRIALGVGSRGIKCLVPVVRTVIEQLKAVGAEPFIIPAMGSHGGATPDGQKGVLAGYGITEASMGVPIEASMEVKQIGVTESGVPVYVSRPALEADGMVPIGRIKAHTAFRGPVESGLHKMLVIGFGKHKGTATIHSYGFDWFARLIPEVGGYILRNAPVAFGVGIVENADDDPAIIEALTPKEIPEREPALLEKAKAWMARILFDEFDALIVDEIGKNISGDGMDPNVTGRFSQPGVAGGPKVQKIAVLDLTEETHGNACGIGAADITTQTVLEKMDFVQTYTNGVTSTVLPAVRMPVVMPTKKSAVQLAIGTCNRVTFESARVVRIKNTLELERIWISESMLEEAGKRKDIEILERAPLVLEES